MNVDKRIVYTGGLAAALLVGWIFFSGSPEKAIDRQLRVLTEIVQKEAAVSQFGALSRSRKLAEIFTENALVEYMPRESLPRGSDAMRSGFLSVWGQIEKASIRISRHEIEVSSSETEAISTFSATCKVVLRGTSQMADTVNYRAYWVKQNDDWLVDRIIAESTD
ncbi:MAG TPA: hypothetical protein DCX06_04760 [Opitutae bacterium]|nr:hypothetical protein [Opitutae bacterium]